MSQRDARRQEILSMRRQEKLKWMALNEIARERAEYNLPPLNMNDPAIEIVARNAIAQVEPDWTAQGLTTETQFKQITPFINSAIAGISGGVVNGGNLLDNNEQAYNRMMGNNEQARREMPYNAGAGDGDPYAALLMHKVLEADTRDAKQAKALAERRQEQTKFLQQQIEMKKRLEKEAKEKQVRIELIEQEKHHEWTRQENAKNYQKELARREEYQRIMTYQKERANKIEVEKQQIREQDQRYLQNIADSQIAADARKKQEAIRWKEEAKKTKMSNDQRLGIRAAQARKEMEEDKERIRLLIQLQKDSDERRLADLEKLNQHQEFLTTLGEKAAEEQAANDARIEAQIAAAIERDEIKREKLDAKKALDKATFLNDQRVWRQQELARKEALERIRKTNEIDEVNQMRMRYLEAEQQDQEKAEAKKLLAQEMNQYLRQQMETRVERDKAMKVAMSPAELAMNAGVLNTFSPAQKPDRSQMLRRTGNNVIF